MPTLLGCLIMASGFFGTGASAHAQTPPPFSISLQAVHGRIDAGAPVALQAEITNISGHDIGVLRNPPSLVYDIEVRDVNGKLIELSPKGRKFRNSGVGIVSAAICWLKPGESFKEELILSELFEMSLPDKYSVTVRRKVPPDLGRGEVASNTLVVEVVAAGRE